MRVCHSATPAYFNPALRMLSLGLAATLDLLLVHPRVGKSDESLERARLGRFALECPAKTHSDCVVMRVRFCERSQVLFQPLAQLVQAVHVGTNRQYDELVAALSSKNIGRADGGAQYSRHFLQRHVTLGVSKSVVDRLEPVDVDEQQGHEGTGSRRAGRCPCPRWLPR